MEKEIKQFGECKLPHAYTNNSDISLDETILNDRTSIVL